MKSRGDDMTDAAAIRATFADYKRVRGRKVGQLIFEVPLEELHDAVKRLGGEPSVNQDTWCAIAVLVEAKQGAVEKTKRRFDELPLPQQAALLCNREAFWRFINDHDFSFSPENEDQAADWLRRQCRIKSRADLAHSAPAQKAFRVIVDRFNLWLNHPEIAA